MKRLTNDIKLGFQDSNKLPSYVGLWDHLKKYEDTGLEPEEIVCCINLLKDKCWACSNARAYKIGNSSLKTCKYRMKGCVAATAQPECEYKCCSGWNDEEAKCMGIGMHCQTREQIDEEASQAKIASLNTIFVEEWDIDEDGINSILVADSPENRKVILELGASKAELENMKVEPYKLLDISKFAFEYTDAEWWCNSRGFGNGDMPS